MLEKHFLRRLGLAIILLKFKLAIIITLKGGDPISTEKKGIIKIYTEGDVSLFYYSVDSLFSPT